MRLQKSETLPNRASLNITQSDMKEYTGYLKVAGLFSSTKKWDIHAKP